MTERQEKTLEAIRKFTVEHGYAPSYRELGRLLGTSSSASVAYTVRALKKAGRLESEPRSPRTLRVTDLPYVPELVLAYEDIPGWWSVMDDNFAGPPGKQRYASFPSRKEAEAYRQGWWDGWNGE